MAKGKPTWHSCPGCSHPFSESRKEEIRALVVDDTACLILSRREMQKLELRGHSVSKADDAEPDIIIKMLIKVEGIGEGLLLPRRLSREDLDQFCGIGQRPPKFGRFKVEKGTIA